MRGRPTRRTTAATSTTSTTATTRRVGTVLACLAAVAFGNPARAGDPENPAPCEVPAFLVEGTGRDDAGLRAAYDGVRRGLEDAALPRVCLRPVRPDEPAAWAETARAVSAEKAPFLVALGRRAGERVASTAFVSAAGERIPCVYVDVATVVSGRTLPPPLDPPRPAAIVRAEIPVAAWGPVVRALLPGRPRPSLLLPWREETAAAAALRREAAASAGLDLRTLRDPGVADAILDWTPGAGETAVPFTVALEQARTLRVPLLSGDRGAFGRGAAVVLTPDHGLLGRSAAEAARRLRAGEEGDTVRITVRTTEVWVDLEAADAQGLRPPLSFLAGADRLRRGPRPAPPPGDGGGR